MPQAGRRRMPVACVLHAGAAGAPALEKSAQKITLPSQQTLFGSPRAAGDHGSQVISRSGQVIRLPAPGTPRLPRFQHGLGSAFLLASAHLPSAALFAGGALLPVAVQIGGRGLSAGGREHDRLPGPLYGGAVASSRSDAGCAELVLAAVTGLSAAETCALIHRLTAVIWRGWPRPGPRACAWRAAGSRG